MSSERVLLSINDAVGTITLNRPDRHNAIDNEMSVIFAEYLHAVIKNPAIKVIVLRGEGQSFCSGRDVSQLGTRKDNESDFLFVRRAQDTRLAMLECPKPIIAAVRGHAIGGGLEMALACDIRIAASDVKMRMPEINYGLLPDTGGTQFITTLAGPSRAKLMIMTGEPIGADDAFAWGLVDKVVTPEQLDETVAALATTLASKSSLGLALAKQLVDQNWVPAAREGIRQELVAQIAMFADRDKQGAIRGQYDKS